MSSSLCYLTMKTIEQFYAELGFKTQERLQRVRGIKAAKMTWEEFSALPQFKKAMAGRKVRLSELEAFKEGFLYSLNRKNNGS